MRFVDLAICVLPCRMVYWNQRTEQRHFSPNGGFEMYSATLTKSTFKTICRKGFDLGGLEDFAEFFGWTLTTKNGLFILTDGDGEFVDSGMPVMLNFDGVKYPGVYWSELESTFECGWTFLDTGLDDIDTSRLY